MGESLVSLSQDLAARCSHTGFVRGMADANERHYEFTDLHRSQAKKAP